MTFVASAKQRILLTLGALGRGLQQVASGNVEVRLSTDAGQSMAFGSDGGVIVTASAIANAALPAVAASDNGKELVAQGGSWTKALVGVPALLGTTVFNTSQTQVNLQAILAALSYAPQVKGFSIQCVGGGASGRCGGSYGGQGGMPGLVDETPRMPVSALASLTSVDVSVGGGGASYTTTNNYTASNAGTPSTVSIHSSGLVVLLGGGGPAAVAGTSASWWDSFASVNMPSLVSFFAKYFPSLSQSDHSGSSISLSATTGGYGPGAGGTASYNTAAAYGQGGWGKGDMEQSGNSALAVPYVLPVAGVGAAGVSATTDRTFGSGGNGGNSQGTPKGGQGGVPGGGGGGSYGSNASGAGAAGIVRVFWWG